MSQCDGAQVQSGTLPYLHHGLGLGRRCRLRDDHEEQDSAALHQDHGARCAREDGVSLSERDQAALHHPLEGERQGGEGLGR